LSFDIHTNNQTAIFSAQKFFWHFIISVKIACNSDFGKYDLNRCYIATINIIKKVFSCHCFVRFCPTEPNAAFVQYAAIFIANNRTCESTSYINFRIIDDVIKNVAKITGDT